MPKKPRKDPNEFRPSDFRAAILAMEDEEDRRTIATAMADIDMGRLIKHEIRKAGSDVEAWCVLLFVIFGHERLCYTFCRPSSLEARALAMEMYEMAARIGPAPMALEGEPIHQIGHSPLKTVAVLVIGRTADGLDAEAFWHNPTLTYEQAAGMLKQFALSAGGRTARA